MAGTPVIDFMINGGIVFHRGLHYRLDESKWLQFDMGQGWADILERDQAEFFQFIVEGREFNKCQ